MVKFDILQCAKVSYFRHLFWVKGQKIDKSPNSENCSQCPINAGPVAPVEKLRLYHIIGGPKPCQLLLQLEILLVCVSCSILWWMRWGVGWGPSVSAAFRRMQEWESRSSELENCHPVQQKVAQVMETDRHCVQLSLTSSVSLLSSFLTWKYQLTCMFTSHSFQRVSDSARCGSYEAESKRDGIASLGPLVMQEFSNDQQKHGPHFL